jgi:hypothetical protein
MQPHVQIIAHKDAQTWADVLGVSVHTVLSWRQRKSIPHEQWAPAIAAGLTTLEDLSPDLAQAISGTDRQDAAA